MVNVQQQRSAVKAEDESEEERKTTKETGDREVNLTNGSHNNDDDDLLCDKIVKIPVLPPILFLFAFVSSVSCLQQSWSAFSFTCQQPA